ncbi:MAG: methylated-DNA--[protein]-cysteine S-methyltransferase [Candidatus Izemoplasmatales bacterium]|nr:methylated-DNA--[protein]-cysteine S-methyltransferase [Candidatus Izemoplasmatales bacterium]
MKKYSFKSKLGYITLFSKNEKIIKIILKSEEIYNDPPNEAMLLAEKEILDYLDNKTTSFSFPIELEGSDFFKKVLFSMKQIPYGTTYSYSKLAEKSGYSKAVRAVGTVCKNNPLPLIIPCHRVIKKDGLIGNFNGGVELKQYLLNLEKKSSN